MSISPGQFLHACVIILLSIASAISPARAQNYTPTPNDTLQSVTVLPDRHLTFRIYAPSAAEVLLDAGDIPDSLRTAKPVKKDNGVWEVTVGPVLPGAYRYNFLVDKVHVLDPRNPSISESSTAASSLMYVPGSELFDQRNVDHGSVAEVTYYSTALKRFRRMHVYTPHGYESGEGKYPVFYLLHGAYDTDDAWHTVGRASLILDNLIADKKVVPMIVIMPAGHTRPFPGPRPPEPQRDEFVEDFLTDVQPYAETHYRIITDRAHRAIAGLSMGGAQTLNVAIPHLADFAYIGVYSSGIFELGRKDGAPPIPAGQSWEERNMTTLDNKDLKNGLRLFWFATGKDDFLLGVTHATVDLFRKHGFDVVYEETAGGHTWINWRDYLAEFTPMLFK